jgi:hypothetical protein
MIEWLPAWDVLCMWIGCGCVGGMVFLLVAHWLVIKPMADENERLARELDEETRTTWPNGPWSRKV